MCDEVIQPIEISVSQESMFEEIENLRKDIEEALVLLKEFFDETTN